MIMIQKKMASIALTSTVMLAGSHAIGVVQYFADGQDIFVSINLVGTNLYDVQITDNASSGGTVWVFSTVDGGDSIRFLTVNNAVPNITLNLKPKDPNNNNRFKSVRNIAPSNSNQGFLLAVLNTTGDITESIDVGDNGNIGTIFAGGNINAPIHAGRLISFIRANGNITGNIISDTDRILEIEAGFNMGVGDIGSPGFPVLITADGAVNGSGTQKIIGDSIYADIDMAAGPNGGGPFGRLQTRTGDFDGSLHVNQLVSNNGNADIIIAGNLNADITVDNQVETLISTGGDFTKTMTIGGALSGAMKGILIGGDLTASASIAIAGDIDAPITVDGDILDNVTMPSIFASGSLFNDGTNSFGSIDILGTKPGSNGDLSGEIFITGDLAGPIHLAGSIIATLTPMASINIGGSIKADAVSGMEGQILIDGGMFGDITIGSDVEGLTANDATRNIDIT